MLPTNTSRHGVLYLQLVTSFKPCDTDSAQTYNLPRTYLCFGNLTRCPRGHLQRPRMAQEAHIPTLFPLHDNQEKRNRRNNTCIRCLPETTGDGDLLPTVKGIFSHLLGASDDLHLEIDWVYIALGPRSTSPACSRNVICWIHYSCTKEDFMAKARTQGPFEFNGATLSLLQNLSKHTLDQRRELKPLLNHLRDRSNPYRWGFPFNLQIQGWAAPCHPSTR